MREQRTEIKKSIKVKNKIHGGVARRENREERTKDIYLAVVIVNPGRMERATMFFASSQRPDEVRKRHAASIVRCVHCQKRPNVEVKETY